MMRSLVLYQSLPSFIPHTQTEGDTKPNRVKKASRFSEATVPGFVPIMGGSNPQMPLTDFSRLPPGAAVVAAALAKAQARASRAPLRVPKWIEHYFQKTADIVGLPWRSWSWIDQNHLHGLLV
jgi:hypothetical protein